MTALTITVIILTLLLLGAISELGKLKELQKTVDKEQHEQNMEILKLIKENHEIKTMMLQHIEVLKYLCDQDPLLGRVKMPYTGPIGEA